MNDIFNPKTVSYDQHEILQWIQELHCPNGFHVDATYGNGSFYKKSGVEPIFKFDMDWKLPNCAFATSTSLPLPDSFVSSVVFDPPFLTYVRSARSGNGKMIMSNRFSGYWRYDELETHYKASLLEFSRILCKKGIVVFKCQDIIHNHKMHCTHVNVINWASEFGFRLKDLFVLPAKHRLPRPNKGKAKHARIYHSYFLVLELTK